MCTFVVYMNQGVILVGKVSHRGQQVWMMSFPYDKDLIQNMKSIKARYSRTYTSWYVLYDDYTPDQIDQRICHTSDSP